MRTLVLCLALLAAGCGPKPATPPKATQPAATQPGKATEDRPLGEPVAKLNAAVLWQDYRGNEAQADLKYLDKVVEVTGTGTVRKDAEGYYLGEEVVQDVARVWPPGVVCRMKPSQSQKLAELPAGKRWSVRGVCGGRTAAQGAYQGFVVVLKDCELAGPP